MVSNVSRAFAWSEVLHWLAKRPTRIANSKSWFKAKLFQFGLAWDQGGQVLYLNVGPTSTLYRVNPETGEATRIGANLVSGIDGLAFVVARARQDLEERDQDIEESQRREPQNAPQDAPPGQHEDDQQERHPEQRPQIERDDLVGERHRRVERTKRKSPAQRFSRLPSRFQ